MRLRRSDHSEKEKEMLRKIETEYSLFRYRMLSDSVQKVYDACRKICFYECVNEYFQYSRETSADFINATGQSDKILAELWKIYLKNEYLGMDTWEDIEDILNTYTDRHKL